MTKYQILPFIDNNSLYKIIEDVLGVAGKASDKAGKHLYRNVIDPFSALFDAGYQGIPIKDWLTQEKARQAQKTLQNELGSFHEKVLGSMPGWVSIDFGGVADVKNKKQSKIAEIKNKYNTTKGNHKVRIYDDLESLLEDDYRGYTAYYVEVIPQNKRKYDVPFTPSDNQTSIRRPENKNIRRIDGWTFYDMASGHTGALEMLYDALPEVIGNVLGIDMDFLRSDGLIQKLFKQAY